MESKMHFAPVTSEKEGIKDKANASENSDPDSISVYESTDPEFGSSVNEDGANTFSSKRLHI